jgi:hypothetical protein
VDRAAARDLERDAVRPRSPADEAAQARPSARDDDALGRRTIGGLGRRTIRGLGRRTIGGLGRRTIRGLGRRTIHATCRRATRFFAPGATLVKNWY